MLLKRMKRRANKTRAKGRISRLAARPVRSKFAVKAPKDKVYGASNVLGTCGGDTSTLKFQHPLIVGYLAELALGFVSWQMVDRIDTRSRNVALTLPERISSPVRGT